jgi:hypothetical protein
MDVVQALPETEERRRFGLLWAFGLSILAHLLLVWLTIWFPVTSRSAELPVDPDDTITFRFAQSLEPTTANPLEDAPFTPLEPQSSPEIPPIEQAEQPPSPEPVTPPEVLQEPAPTATIEEQPAATDFPERSAGPTHDPVPEDSPTPESPQLDLTQALRDFRRTMAREPSTRSQLPPSEGVKRNEIAPDLSQIPYSGFGVGNLVFESRDYDWSDYGRQVYNAIWQAWHRRLWMTTDDFEKWAHRNGNWYLNHQTQVRFVILRNGQVTGILQEAEAGCEPLNASAIDALTEVILPPLPPAFPRDQEVVHARFIATGQIRAMRRSLSALKAAGFF